MIGAEVLVLTGPTTSGKTALSIELAERLGGEIISADSRQVYRGMDIGTDKVALPHRARVPHHGLDLVDPDQRYSAGRFQRDAVRAIQAIHGRGRLPIVAGGTGFFLKALQAPLFDEPPLDPARRQQLDRVLRDWDHDTLSRAVRRLDPERSAKAIAGGRQRMMRTIEVALLTGKPLSRWHRDAPSAPQATLRFTTVVLSLPREELDTRIDARVGRMVERGFINEVERLRDAGYGSDAPGMTGTGYRDVLAFLEGESTLEAALESMRLQTRQYARRQLTWFRHQLPEAARVEAPEMEKRVAEVERIWGDRDR